MLAISLSDNISCEYLCNSIQKLISKEKNLKDKLLVIDLKNIIDSNDSLLPKLEFKEETSVAR